MKKKIEYTDEKIGKVKIVKDFLPKSEDLVFKYTIKKPRSVFLNKNKKVG